MQIDGTSSHKVQIRRYTDPQLFLDRSQEWLLSSELENSQILSVAQLLTTDDHPFEPPFYLATIETETDIVGCAVCPPPDKLILSEVPGDAIPLLVADVAAVYEKFPGVSGVRSTVEAFAEHWNRRGGSSLVIKNRWRWYALDRAVMPRKPAPGTLRLAESSDLDLVRAWAMNFARETGTSVDVVAFFERRVHARSLYLWEDEEPRSLVALSGVTPNSIRISGVYTASDYRQNGYATVAVATVSRSMIEAGRQFCLLYADITDPLANRLYRKVGYKPIFDTVSICLTD